MVPYVSGLITMGYLIAGLFFLRFWHRTRDRLFMIFAIAFWLFAGNQALVALAGVTREEQTWFYFLRLAGFLLIIAGIIAKNVGPRRAP